MPLTRLGLPGRAPGVAPGEGHARPRLICPAISPRDLEGFPASIDADAIRAAAAAYADPCSTFGLELRVAYRIEARGAGAADTERLRQPFFRLAQEPIIWSWWDKLKRAPLDPGEMLALASMLKGGEVRYREREMFAHGGGRAGNRYYETPARARSWIADIAAADRAGGDPVKKALYRFARIVCAHPFSDGNGRFARAALQAGLARDGVIAAPCLALAPVFCLHSARIEDALSGLSRSGRWRFYFDAMGAVLDSALTWIAAPR